MEGIRCLLLFFFLSFVCLLSLYHLFVLSSPDEEMIKKDQAFKFSQASRLGTLTWKFRRRSFEISLLADSAGN